MALVDMGGVRMLATQSEQNLLCDKQGKCLNSKRELTTLLCSRNYRVNESGNAMKALLGTPNLKWDVNNKQGAYTGKVRQHLY
jgi:hypothetical protein